MSLDIILAEITSNIVQWSFVNVKIMIKKEIRTIVFSYFSSETMAVKSQRLCDLKISMFQGRHYDSVSQKAKPQTPPGPVPKCRHHPRVTWAYLNITKHYKEKGLHKFARQALHGTPSEVSRCNKNFNEKRGDRDLPWNVHILLLYNFVLDPYVVGLAWLFM